MRVVLHVGSTRPSHATALAPAVLHGSALFIVYTLRADHVAPACCFGQPQDMHDSCTISDQLSKLNLCDSGSGPFVEDTSTCNCEAPALKDQEDNQQQHEHAKLLLEPAQQQQQPSQQCPRPAQALGSLDLAGVAELIKSGRSRKIVVMAGAGISVAAGIPDFRTPGTCS